MLMKFKVGLVKESKRVTKNTKSRYQDKKRKAMKPGKRYSKNGKYYWETRTNRSDLDAKKMI